MKLLAGVLTFIVKSRDVEEFVWYIVTDLDMEYNPIVSEVLARIEPIYIFVTLPSTHKDKSNAYVATGLGGVWFTPPKSSLI